VAGGAYLPVLCDKLLMTEGSQLCLAGQALVKAAIGQTVDAEELGGARMHARISGTVDFVEPDDPACLRRLRSLMELLADERTRHATNESIASTHAAQSEPHALYSLFPANGLDEYDMRELMAAIIDAGSIQEYKVDFGPTLITAYAKVAGHQVGIVANQRRRSKTAANELQIGGVLYCDSVEKAARFVMDCNQTNIPLVFIQDVQGFMVGKQSEQAGIIRSGAKLVNVVSNSVVPKFTIIVGGSFGAGNYALCGKAYDPWLIAAWPGARYAVMGAEQAADTVLSLKVHDAERHGRPLSPDDQRRLHDEMRQRYHEQTDIRYGAARGWVDAISAPEQTRAWLAEALSLVPPRANRPSFRTGVLQV
jgi:acetyl-CoA carboxylase carboxyltransferase component